MHEMMGKKPRAHRWRTIVAVRQPSDVRFGPIADICTAIGHVRFTPKADIHPIILDHRNEFIEKSVQCSPRHLGKNDDQIIKGFATAAVN
jgi:hypothetical protein